MKYKQIASQRRFQTAPSCISSHLEKRECWKATTLKRKCLKTTTLTEIPCSLALDHIMRGGEDGAVRGRQTPDHLRTGLSPLPVSKEFKKYRKPCTPTKPKRTNAQPFNLVEVLLKSSPFVGLFYLNPKPYSPLNRATAAKPSTQSWLCSSFTARSWHRARAYRRLALRVHPSYKDNIGIYTVM